MTQRWLSIAAVLTLVALAGEATAQGPAYSFETGSAAAPDGFFGLGAAVSQDTIGATDLQHSLKYDVGVGGFVGARTETVIPAALNDPPGVKAVLFDLTIPTAYAGTFADIGVTIFGHQLNAPGGPVYGQQAQFADTVSIAALGVGTHLDQRIDLDQSVGPYRAGDSFNDIFGPGPDDLTVASAFQFFISKNVTEPVTVYIDNVRLIGVPEPASIGMTAFMGLALAGYCRRKARG
jgi:hypothetical protein